MVSVALLVPATLLNFLIWAYIGHKFSISEHKCPVLPKDKSLGPHPVLCDEPDSDLGHRGTVKGRAPISCITEMRQSLASLRESFEFVSNEVLDTYKENHLAHIRLPEASTLINFHHQVQKECRGYINPYTTQKGGEYCLAIVHVENVPSSSNQLRYKFNKMPDWKEDWMKKKGKSKEQVQADLREKALWATKPKTSTGFFPNAAPQEKDRDAMGRKMLPFLESLKVMEASIAAVLSRRGFHPKFDGKQGGPTRDDELHGMSGLVTMTVNDGEMDMISNFVCSCREHRINTANFLVFAGSKDIVPTLERMGLMAVYHSSFAKVSTRPSAQYLDKTFVDMMWYKAFSVWMLLRMGFHVLFQDVDLVWFREPFGYFAQYMNDTKTLIGLGRSESYPDAFFSDDGARSARYAPFFANSGFYLLRANPRTLYFSWSILSAFDALHQGGSHQNVFTFRLGETLDLYGLSPKLLDINQFPTGVKYHRDRPFMRAIKEGYEKPYNFHMCWTSNKHDKIRYFKNVGMWYVKEQCESPAGMVGPQGIINKRLEKEGVSFQDLCCR